MALSVHDLLLRVSGDGGDAKRELAEISADLNRFDGKRAEAELGIDDAGARISLDSFEAKLDSIGRRTRSPKVKLDIAEAQAQVAILRHELDELGRKRETSQVDVDVGAALAKLEVLKREIASTQRSARRGGGGGSFGFDPLGLAPGGRPPNLFSTRALTSLILASLPLAPTIGASFAQGAVGAGALGVAGGAAGIVGLGSVLPVVTRGFSDLSTAVSSYDTTQKAAGANAIQTSQQELQAAAASQAAAEQVATARRTLSRARTQANQADADAARTLARTEVAANQQVADAERALEQTRQQAHQADMAAERELQGAQQQERFAQVALNAARRQAVRDLEDMQNAAQDAALTEQEARLNLEQARAALAHPAVGSTELDREQLLLDVREAEQALHEAEQGRRRAQDDNARAQRRGIHGDQNVVDARRALTQATNNAAQAQKNLARTERQSSQQIAQAERALSRATVAARRAVADAERNVNRTRISGAQNVADAQRGVNQALDAQGLTTHQNALAAREAAIQNNAFGRALRLLPPAGRDAARSIIDLRKKIQESPAEKTFFGALQDALHTMNVELWPTFKRTSGAAMSALRGGLDQVLNAITGPEFKGFVATMTITFVEAMPKITRAFLDIGRVLGRIAVAAAPDFIDMLNRLVDTTDAWVKHTRNADTLRASVHRLVGQFWAWWHLIEALGHLLAALFITNNRGAANGKRAVQELTRTFNDWAQWLSTHRRPFNEFFGSLLQVVESLASAVAGLAPALAPISRAMVPISHAIASIVQALDSLKIGNVSALTALLSVLVLGKLGAIGGGVLGRGLGAILKRLPGGGATAAEAAGAGAGGGAAAEGATGLLEQIGRLLPKGAAGGAAAGAAAAVLFQSLAGKPGTFLAPGIAGFVPTKGEANKAVQADRELLKRIHDLSISRLQTLRGEVQQQWQRMLETDPENAQTRGQKRLTQIAHETAHQLSLEIRGAHLGNALADTIAENPQRLDHALDGIRHKFLHLNTATQNDLMAAVKDRLDIYRHEGLITQDIENKALRGLERLQHQSFKRQRGQLQDLGKSVIRTIGGSFGSLIPLVDNIFGQKGITGMVNQLLTGVASTKKLKWTVASLGNIAGHLGGEFGSVVGSIAGAGGLVGSLFGGGAARGGQVDRHPGGPMGGKWRGDDRAIAVGGEEYVVRASQARRHERLLDAINRGLLPGYARGGSQKGRRDYFWPFGPGASYSPGGYHGVRVDEGVDFFGSGSVYAMGAGRVVPGNWGFPGVAGLRLDLSGGAPTGPGISPASGHVYMYEGVQASKSGVVRAGELIGRMVGSSNEVGFAEASGQPIAQTYGGPVNAADHHSPAGEAMWAFLQAIRGHKPIGAGGVAAALQLIPRIRVKGPAGALHAIAQGAVDIGRAAANRYLRRHEQVQPAVGRHIGPIGAPARGALKVGEVISGDATYFGEGLGAYGFGPVPGIALDPWPPGGWNDPRITSLAGRMFKVVIGAGHQAILPLVDKGPRNPGVILDIGDRALPFLDWTADTFPGRVSGAQVSLMPRGTAGPRKLALGGELGPGLNLTGESGRELVYGRSGRVYDAGETERILNAFATGAMGMASPPVATTPAEAAVAADRGGGDRQYNFYAVPGEGYPDPRVAAARLGVLERMRQD